MTGGSEGCRCAMCGHKRRSFHCGCCIKRGDFMHSAATPERFAEKQSKLLDKKAVCGEIEKNCYKSPRFQAHLKKETISGELYTLRQKNETLKAAVQQKRDKMIKYRDELNDLRENIDQMKSAMPKWKDTVEAMRERAREQMDITEKINAEMESKSETLHELRIVRLKQLIIQVFPIRIYSKSEYWEMGEEFCTAQVLAEAQQPVSKCLDNGLLPIQILTTTLPTDGDYGAYNHWVTSSKGPVSPENAATNSDQIGGNHAYHLSAGLAHCTQLILNIAFYLDVKLPYNINYNDFCSSELEEHKFNHLVSRLHLCAALIINRISLSRLREKFGYTIQEPPLHVLLRLCPVEPLLVVDYYDGSCDDIFVENSTFTIDQCWWEALNQECLAVTDDEEPVCLNWDPEIAQIDAIPSSSPKGLSESILSFFRPWK